MSHCPRDLSLREVLDKLARAAGKLDCQPRRCGEINHFNEDRGYGFIAPDGGGEDVFFHRRVVRGLVEVGHRVEFELERGGGRPRAAVVCITFVPPETN